MWALPAADIAAMLPRFEMVDVAQTADWSDADIDAFVQLANDVRARPLDLAGCWMSESGLHTTARNPADTTKPAVAVGLFQLTHAAAPGADLDAIRHETVQQQLARARAYYTPHRGRLVSPGACYLATFLPAYMAHAAEPTFVLCSSTLHPEWYFPNRFAFDPHQLGYITVGALTERVELVTKGPRWDEFAARVMAAVQNATTQPDIATEDPPVFVLDTLDSEPPPGAA